MSALFKRVKRLEPQAVDELEKLNDDALLLRIFELDQNLPDEVAIEDLSPEDRALFGAHIQFRKALNDEVRKWAATHRKIGFGAFDPYEVCEEDMLCLPLTGWGHGREQYDPEIRARLRRHPEVSVLVREGIEQADRERGE